jgi:hypothetical protein
MFEDQTVELLPERTTMGGFNFSLFRRGGNTIVGSGNGNDNGNTQQTGLINISILNGSFNGNFNGNGNLLFGNGNA